MKQRFWTGTTIVYMLALLAGSLRPDFDTRPHTQFQEMLHNALHVPGYAVLTFFLIHTFKEFNKQRVRILIFCISVGYGGIIEILQSFVPGRTLSLGDIGLNTLGTVLGLLIFRS